MTRQLTKNELSIFQDIQNAGDAAVRTPETFKANRGAYGIAFPDAMAQAFDQSLQDLQVAIGNAIDDLTAIHLVALEEAAKKLKNLSKQNFQSTHPDMLATHLQAMDKGTNPEFTDIMRHGFGGVRMGLEGHADSILLICKFLKRDLHSPEPFSR